jgi:phosphatidylinositol alpha-1,6-mannosyltransferase
MVFLEASATGLPVLAGDSGGAPDAVRDGLTGEVVPGAEVATVAARLTGLLTDRPRAEAMGRAGRQWVEQAWQWQSSAERLASLLEL